MGITYFTLPLLLSFQRPAVTSSQSLPIPAARPPPRVVREGFSPTASKKRSFSEIIDLTIDDKDFQPPELIERKKSRSSSHLSIETRAEMPGVIERASSELDNSFFPPSHKYHYSHLLKNADKSLLRICSHHSD